jgi:hypothetical protein
MHTIRRYAKCVSIMFLVVTLTLVIGGSYVNADNSWPLHSFDFTIHASTTLIRMQPGSSGSLAVWIEPYCNGQEDPTPSVSWALCNTNELVTVNLTVSGCPSNLYCILDRTQVQAPPLYRTQSEFLVYSFTCATFSCTTFTSTPTTVTVTGTDQFGHTHSAKFGVILWV